MKKETIRNVAGILLLYLVIVLGVIAVNARMEAIEAENTIISLER